MQALAGITRVFEPLSGRSNITNWPFILRKKLLLVGMMDVERLESCMQNVAFDS